MRRGFFLLPDSQPLPGHQLSGRGDTLALAPPFWEAPNEGRPFMAAVTGRTGEKCRVSGEYAPTCTDRYEIPLAEGNTFPPCRGVHGAVTWTLVRESKHKPR
jgi:hypothetical protein